MVIFLLFAILLVLLIMARLLPGVMKFIATAALIGVLVYIVDTYGWLTCLIGLAATLSAAFLMLLLNKLDRENAEKPSYDTDAALAKIDKDQREKRATAQARGAEIKSENAPNR